MERKKIKRFPGEVLFVSVQTFGGGKNPLEEQSCSFFLLRSFPPTPHPPTLLCFLSQSNPPLDMLPLCSATLTSRLVPLLPGRPRRAPDNGMNVATLKPPRGCWEKTQECVGWGDNALFSRGSVGGAGIMGLGADLQPLPAGGAVYTGGGGHRRDVRTSVWNKGLH